MKIPCLAGKTNVRAGAGLAGLAGAVFQINALDSVREGGFAPALHFVQGLLVGLALALLVGPRLVERWRQ